MVSYPRTRVSVVALQAGHKSSRRLSETKYSYPELQPIISMQYNHPYEGFREI